MRQVNASNRHRVRYDVSTNTDMASTTGTSGLTLIGGGVRSGKSRFALARATTLGPRRCFIATAEAGDDEMRTRIVSHQRERDDRFDTIEEPLDLVSRLETLREYDVIVVDCLTLWLSNRLLHDEAESVVRRHVDALAHELAGAHARVIVVSNEVGMGVVPPSALGRAFRDLSGYAHQHLASIADEVLFAAMGVVLELVPGPVRVVTA